MSQLLSAWTNFSRIICLTPKNARNFPIRKSILDLKINILNRTNFPSHNIKYWYSFFFIFKYLF